MKRLTAILFFLGFIFSSNACKIKERNILVVNIKADNTLYVEGKPMELDQLYSYAKRFIMNPFHDEYLPEFKYSELPLIGECLISKQLISLYASRDSDYKTFIAVNNELERAYNDARDEYANFYFNKTFNHLKAKQAYVIKKLCPKRISEAEPNFVRRNGKLIANDYGWWFGCC